MNSAAPGFELFRAPQVGGGGAYQIDVAPQTSRAKVNARDTR